MRTPPRFSPPPPVGGLPPGAQRSAGDASAARGFAPPPPPPPEQKPTNVKVALARKAYEHPKIAAGTVFAALAILGPKKSLRTLTRGLALASVAASAARVASEAMRDAKSEPGASPTPPPPPVRMPRESENGASSHRVGSDRRSGVDDPTIIA
jgi:hypothetical protein